MTDEQLLLETAKALEGCLWLVVSQEIDRSSYLLKTIGGRRAFYALARLKIRFPNLVVSPSLENDLNERVKELLQQDAAKERNDRLNGRK